MRNCWPKERFSRAKGVGREPASRELRQRNRVSIVIVAHSPGFLSLVSSARWRALCASPTRTVEASPPFSAVSCAKCSVEPVRVSLSRKYSVRDGSIGGGVGETAGCRTRSF